MYHRLILGVQCLYQYQKYIDIDVKKLLSMADAIIFDLCKSNPYKLNLIIYYIKVIWFWSIKKNTAKRCI